MKIKVYTIGEWAHTDGRSFPLHLIQFGRNGLTSRLRSTSTKSSEGHRVPRRAENIIGAESTGTLRPAS